MSLKVFITGGTTGIGLSLAKLYLSKGSIVGVCGRDLSKLEFTHKNLTAYQIDVQEREQLINCVAEFSGGKLDLFIANAGRSISNKDVIPDFILAHNVMNINVGGVLNSFEAALNIMRPQRSGQIVAIASVAGMVGLPGAGAYSASKAAVLTLCESYAIDLAQENITVTAIAPGFIDTPLTQKNKHDMPWLMSSEKAALKMYSAISKKKSLYVFPVPMMILMFILSRLPRSWYSFMMQLPFMQYRK